MYIYISSRSVRKELKHFLVFDEYLESFAVFQKFKILIGVFHDVCETLNDVFRNPGGGWGGVGTAVLAHRLNHVSAAVML